MKCTSEFLQYSKHTIYIDTLLKKLISKSVINIANYSLNIQKIYMKYTLYFSEL